MRTKASKSRQAISRFAKLRGISHEQARAMFESPDPDRNLSEATKNHLNKLHQLLLEEGEVTRKHAAQHVGLPINRFDVILQRATIQFPIWEDDGMVGLMDNAPNFDPSVFDTLRSPAELE